VINFARFCDIMLLKSTRISSPDDEGGPSTAAYAIAEC
ncbi:MAG: hypothetical protein ACI8RD_014539, partial [Bacillariaceae sp.]